MKKILKAGLCAAAAAVIVTGCGHGGEKETTAAQTATEAAAETKSQEELTDEASITVGNYTGLGLSVKKEEVTEEMIDNELEALRTGYPVQVTDRAAKDGDTVNIDYAGTKDGVAFSGGTASGADLTLGSGQFIDGFEDGVVGMMPGEEKDLNLTFPEDYGNADLAGQAVVFHVTLNYIKDTENSKIDDDLAKRVTGNEDATLDTLRETVTNNLESQMESDFFNAAGNELLGQAVANSQITCDPDAVDQMYNDLHTTYEAYAKQYGLDLSTFLSMFMGTDEEGLKTVAEDLVKQEMVLNEIVKKENLTATDEQKASLAKMNFFDSADAMTNAYGEESADRLFRMGAAYYFLIDHSVEVEEPVTTEAAEAAETDAVAESGAAETETDADPVAESGAETTAEEK